MLKWDRPWREQLTQLLDDARERGDGEADIDVWLPGEPSAGSVNDYGRTNLRAFCSAPPGTLHYKGRSWKRGDGYFLHFAYRAKGWALEGVAGELALMIYPPIDFECLDAGRDQ